MTTATNKKSYHYLYSDLMRQIEERKLLPGMTLLSENTMASTYGVSRPTVRRALKMLEKDNAIVRRPGVGSFVNDRRNPVSAMECRQLMIGTDMIGSDAWFYQGMIFKGLKESCERNSCQLTLVNKNDLQSGSVHVDGLILASVLTDEFDYYADLAATGLPVAVINRFPARPELAYFSVDYRRETVKAVDYMLMLGHRRIAVLGASDGESAPGQRTEGWKMAYSRRGLEAPLELSFPFSEMCGAGNDKLVAFLKENQITGVFVTLGALIPVVAQAMARAGLRAPDNLMLMCFDDMEETLKLLGLPVSYVKMPLQEMGQVAVEYLIKRYQNPNEPTARRLFDASLIINSGLNNLTHA